MKYNSKHFPHISKNAIIVNPFVIINVQIKYAGHIVIQHDIAANKRIKTIICMYLTYFFIYFIYLSSTRYFIVHCSSL